MCQKNFKKILFINNLGHKNFWIPEDLVNKSYFKKLKLSQKKLCEKMFRQNSFCSIIGCPIMKFISCTQFYKEYTEQKITWIYVSIVYGCVTTYLRDFDQKDNVLFMTFQKLVPKW